MKEQLNFITNTLLKNLVGKDLINDDNIAIVELVKNAYDAGSDVALVRFLGFGRNGKTSSLSKIIVADKGSGMNLDDIREKWLNIAYSDKNLKPAITGAQLAGNKGVGRFSCDRLGERLDLLTRAKGGDILHMAINWPDFEIEGRIDLTIQSIKVSVASISENEAIELCGFIDFPKTGTVLVVSDLRSQWDRETISPLKESLEKFLNPNQLFLRKKFKITLSAPELLEKEHGKDYAARVNVEIRNQIFDKLEFNSTFIESTISSDNKTITTELNHDGKAIFKLVERNESYPLLRDVRVVIYYLNQYKKAYFKRQTGIRTVDFGSIFLFLNGFRIAPYGDRGDDWLGIDFRKTQGTTRYLGSRDILGRIEISDGEERFKPISSREGLKKTDAFNQLREKFFIEALRKLEKFVVDGLDWDSVPDSLRNELRKSDGLDWTATKERYIESSERKNQRITLSIMTLISASPENIVSFWFNPTLLDEVYQTREIEVKALLGKIEEIDPSKIDSNLKRGMSRVRSLIKKKEQEASLAKKEAADLRVKVTKQATSLKKLKAEKDTYQAQTLFLQSVSSLDANELVAFHHQIVHDATTVNNYVGRSLKLLKKSDTNKELIKFIEKISSANKRIIAVAQFATKANFRAGIAKEVTDLPAFIEQYIVNVAKEFVATNLRVKVENLVHEPFEINVSRIELSIMIDNFLSNADKADAKNVAVRMKLGGKNTLEITFTDNGNGLSPKLESAESMFEMGVTTTTGSGLGLYHVREIVSKMGGTVSARPLLPGPGMEIHLVVTR
jgi:signal transduction histidine kinase